MWYRTVGWTWTDKDNEWRRVIGFLASTVDSKSNRAELQDELDSRLRCIDGRLAEIQSKVQETPTVAAVSKKARCLVCDTIVRVQPNE